jgi:hypothetical protein
MKDVGSWRCQKNFLCILTTDRLMGVAVMPKRASEAASVFVRKTDRFPLSGAGDVKHTHYLRSYFPN